MADGKGEQLPDTVLAMLQARIGRLPARERAVLRAAGIFGPRFWRGGVQALLSPPFSQEEIDHGLETLEQEEFIEKQSGSQFPGETEFMFRHALMSEAAYSLIPPEDCKLSHRSAAAYLCEIREADAAVIADHLYRSDEPKRAVPHYMQAAMLCVQKLDLQGLMRLSRASESAGAEGSDLALSRAGQVMALFWRNDLEGVLELGHAPVMEQIVGKAHWYTVLGICVLASGMLGRPMVTADLLRRMMMSTPQPESSSAFVRAAGLIVVILSVAGMRDLVRLQLARIETMAQLAAELDPLARAWALQAQHMFLEHLDADPYRALMAGQDAGLLFSRYGDHRGQLTVYGMTAIAQGAMGDVGGAIKIVRECFKIAKEYEAQFVTLTARSQLCQVLVMSAEPDLVEEAQREAQKLLETGGGSRHHVGLAHSVSAEALRKLGRLDEALVQVELARQVLTALPIWRLDALRTQLLILLELERVDALRPLLAEVAQQLAMYTPSGRHEIPLRLALAEACLFCGETERARAELRTTLQQIALRASRIPDPKLRRKFIDYIPDHISARQLAQQWQVEFDMSAAIEKGLQG